MSSVGKEKQSRKCFRKRDWPIRSVQLGSHRMRTRLVPTGYANTDVTAVHVTAVHGRSFSGVVED